MKQNSIYFIMALLLLVACQDHSTEYIFEQSINDRFEEKKAEYQQLLMSSVNGWSGNYCQNGEVGSHKVLMKFINESEVYLRSDYYTVGTKGNHISYSENDTITYRIDKTLKMELVLESHTVFHQIYEIDQNGTGGEYVFNLNSTSPDEILLVSKTDNGYNGEEITELVLNKATLSEWDIKPLYDSEYHLLGADLNKHFSNIETSEGMIAAFDFDALNRSVIISYYEEDKVVTVNKPVILNKKGFTFKTPLKMGKWDVKGFEYNAEIMGYYDASSKLSIKFSNTPFIPIDVDITESKIWWNNAYDPEKTSAEWDEYFQTFNTDLITKYGLMVQYFELNDLHLPVHKLVLGTNGGEAAFEFTHEIKADGKIYFSLVDPENQLVPLFAPLLDMLILGEQGYFIKDGGKMNQYANWTYNLINAAHPEYKINYLKYR